jgi:hypothetical protein
MDGTSSVVTSFVLCPEELIPLDHLPPQIVPENRSVLLPAGLTLKEIEKKLSGRRSKETNGKRL